MSEAARATRRALRHRRHGAASSCDLYSRLRANERSRHASASSICRLLSYVRPYAKVFALAVLGMMLAAATEPLFPALIKPLLDGGFAQGEPTWPPLAFAAAIVGIFVVRGILTFSSSYCLDLGGEQSGARPARGDVRAPGALPGEVLRRQHLGRAALQGRLRRDRRDRARRPRCSPCWSRTRSRSSGCSPGSSTSTGSSR